MDWSKINAFIEIKSMGLMEHENLINQKDPRRAAKDYVRARFDPSKASYITDRGEILLS
jgi:hypothetical protein